MKKKLILILYLCLLSLTCAYANIDSYTTLNIGYSLDTNIFSSPLPLYDDAPDFTWLKWRQNNPFVKKHSLELNLTEDIFFKENSRVGISIGLDAKIPLSAKTFTPTPNDPLVGFQGNWEYIEKDVTSIQKTAVFGSLGPIFRAQFRFLDLGVALRLSLGGYDYIQKEAILGLQAEPYFNFYINKICYISTKLTYDVHFLRLIEDEISIYEDHYQMISLAPSLGIGIKL